MEHSIRGSRAGFVIAGILAVFFCAMLARAQDEPLSSVSSTTIDSTTTSTTSSSTTTTTLRPLAQIWLEGESGRGFAVLKQRTHASGFVAICLSTRQSQVYSFALPTGARYSIAVRYSNDNYGPTETVEVEVDGLSAGEFEAHDTGNYGYGWEVFLVARVVSSIELPKGEHELAITPHSGDGFGVEIDAIILNLVP